MKRWIWILAVCVGSACAIPAGAWACGVDLGHEPEPETEPETEPESEPETEPEPEPESAPEPEEDHESNQACPASVTEAGCCQGKILTWCENGVAQTLSCKSTCGWNSAEEFYDCGQEEFADPSGQFPYGCDGGDSPIEADGETEIAPSEPETGGGVDALPADPLCETLGYPTQGCCSENQLIYCEEGHIQTLNCAGSCGWNMGLQGYDCDVPAVGDPSGIFPINCEAAGFPEVYWTPKEEDAVDAEPSPVEEDFEGEGSDSPDVGVGDGEDGGFVGGTYAIEPNEKPAEESDDSTPPESGANIAVTGEKEDTNPQTPQIFAIPRAADESSSAPPLTPSELSHGSSTVNELQSGCQTRTGSTTGVLLLALTWIVLGSFTRRAEGE